MVIVDTTVWADYLRGVESAQTLWFARNLTRQRFGLTDLILCEVLQGAPSDTAFGQMRRELSNFEVFSGDRSLAIAAATNFRYLRDRGHTVRKTIDCLIATFCIEAGHELLHSDRDFDPFEHYLGLRVVR